MPLKYVSFFILNSKNQNYIFTILNILIQTRSMIKMSVNNFEMNYEVCDLNAPEKIPINENI